MVQHSKGAKRPTVRSLPFIPGCHADCGRWINYITQFNSVAQSCLTLWPNGLQHARLSCPSPTPRVYSNSCPLSLWCQSTIFSSVIPFSCLQFFPASRSFLMSQLFTSGGQSIGASAWVLPVNFQELFPLGLTALISLWSKGLSRVFSNTTDICRVPHVKCRTGWLTICNQYCQEKYQQPQRCRW